MATVDQTIAAATVYANAMADLEGGRGREEAVNSALAVLEERVAALHRARAWKPAAVILLAALPVVAAVCFDAGRTVERNAWRSSCGSDKGVHVTRSISRVEHYECGRAKP